VATVSAKTSLEIMGLEDVAISAEAQAGSRKIQTKFSNDF
jgi:hypothetical protein